MAFDERLADRVRRVLSARGDFAERRMFGGIAFMVGGHMCCGIVGRDLMVRVGADQHQEALKQPHARVMDFTGRPSEGMVYVGPAGVKTEAALRSWIEKALAFLSTLPAKTTAKRKAKVRRPRPRFRAR